MSPATANGISSSTGELLKDGGMFALLTSALSDAALYLSHVILMCCLCVADIRIRNFAVLQFQVITIKLNISTE